MRLMLARSMLLPDSAFAELCRTSRHIVLGLCASFFMGGVFDETGIFTSI